jgi:hypothetical protein
MRAYNFNLVPEKYRNIVRVLAAWEQDLSDGYRYYCENAATKETLEECSGDQVLAVLTEVAKMIIGESLPTWEQTMSDGIPSDGVYFQAMEIFNAEDAPYAPTVINFDADGNYIIPSGQSLLQENDNLYASVAGLAKMLQEEIDRKERLLDLLLECVEQACFYDNGTLDSCHISTYADAMRVLGEYGKLKITKDHGRSVIAEYPNVQSRKDETDEHKEE